MNKLIGIVYYIDLTTLEDWRLIIRRQLTDVAASGILKEASLYFEVCDPDDTPDLEEFLRSLGVRKAVIAVHHGEPSEYYALRRLWELARDEAHTLLIHLRGIGPDNNYGGLLSGNRSRSLREMILTFYTFRNWRRTVRLFKDKPGLCKAGPFPNDTEGQFPESIIWFNFFWVRASYIRELIEPTVPLPRHDCRTWLTMRADGSMERCGDTCWSTYADYSLGFGQREVLTELRKLCWFYKYTWPVSWLLRALGLRGII